MWRMIRFCIVLLLLVRLVGAQGRGDIVTVTGLYSDGGSGEYQEILVPCDSHEVWEVATTGGAFTALAQAYASAETRGQLTKYGEIFVEARGRYRAYEGEERIHTDGIFEVTELARHSTAAADIKACGSECEDIYGANAPTCLEQEDGQCGSTRDSCVAGGSFDDDVSLGTTDTATHDRWECIGSYGGDSVLCTAPKPVLGVGAAPPVSARSLLGLNWSEAPPAAIQALLDQGAEATVRDRAGTTPLHFAAGANRNPAVAALLLDRGADLQAHTRGDCLHFLRPPSRDRQAVLRAVDGLVDWAGTTPLHCAAGANRNPAVMALLLNRGADLTMSNKHGTTPLHFAAAGNANPAVAALLLDRGAAINGRDALGHTPLHVAVRHNAAPVVALLLDRGATVDARNTFGHTPLHSVTVRADESSAVVALLLDRGAAVNARDAILGETPLHYVAGRSTAIPAVAALLLDRRATVDARNSFGRTPLHLAALYNGTPALVALLLDRGADATLRDNAGKLPIDYVRRNAALKGTDISRRLNDPRF